MPQVNPPPGTVVLVKFRAKPGLEHVFARQMLSVIPGTRAEPGNRQFELYVDQADPNGFVLYEEFADQAALQAHQARPEMKIHLAKVGPMFDGDPEPSFWDQALTNGGAGSGVSPRVGHATLVRFRLHAESVDAILGEIRGDLDRMDGNIRFDLNRSRADPLDCLICARWASRMAWETHNAQPAFKGFVARTARFLATPMQRSLWQPPVV